MDTLRGGIGSSGEDRLADLDDEGAGYEAPPPRIGQAERRMQVRAYELWASLLGDRALPAISDLAPADHPDLAAHGVVLDLAQGTTNPRIVFLGDRLAAECGAAAGEVDCLAKVPRRSLLHRITDHCRQVVINPAPLGFEAEIVDEAGRTILYRGILLPFTTDASTVSHIFGVMNWKEAADPRTADELLLELDQIINASVSRADASAPGNAPRPSRDEALATKLRAAEAHDLAALRKGGSEFSLALIRRTGSGRPVVLGELPGEGDLFEQAARRLLG